MSGDLFGVELGTPAISMWQPWASLVFMTDPAFRKSLETRGRRYPSKYDGVRIAIHAGAASPDSSLIRPHITAALDDLARRAFGSDYARTLPRGCYLGTVLLGGCAPSANLEPHLGYANRVAGIWGDGRFGWHFEKQRPLSAPIPAKGKQGWWTVPAADLDHPAASRGLTREADNG